MDSQSDGNFKAAHKELFEFYALFLFSLKFYSTWNVTQKLKLELVDRFQKWNQFKFKSVWLSSNQFVVKFYLAAIWLILNI